MNLTDPVEHFLAEFNYDPDIVEKIVVGNKYLACLLKNGQLGVCATLGHAFSETYTYQRSPRTEQICDRILLNAYFNASLNYDRKYDDIKDIYEFIPFKKYKRIVMIGYFTSLVAKFKEAGIQVDIFDLNENQPGVLSMTEQQNHIAQADALIITSTTIFNRSFTQLVKSTRAGSDVFMLGPSTILHPFLYEYPNISRIFGMIFPSNQELILNMILEGHGTPSFGKYGQKVYL